MAARILIVDDASVFRLTLTRQLEKEKGFTVAGSAKNGEEALKMIRELLPDVVILDLEMPVMDGLRTLEELKKLRPAVNPKVIMFSSHTVHGADKTLKALSLGALDFVAKPSGGSLSEGQREIERTLIPIIHGLVGDDLPKAAQRPEKSVRPQTPASRGVRKDVIGLGISTGGPEALAQLIPKLDADMRCPLLLVQHMPPIFTHQLAERLNSLSAIRVKEAEEGDALRQGHVYIAPGDFHMAVELDAGKRIIRLNQGPPVNSCRPSVDVLFKSLAENFGNRTLGIIMTGIGQDGLSGCVELRKKGASIITQEKDSCVVYGMPRFVNEASLADETVPLDEIAEKTKYYMQ